MRRLRTLAAAACFYLGYYVQNPGRNAGLVSLAWAFSGYSLIGGPVFGPLPYDLSADIREDARAIARKWRSWT